VVSSVAAGEDTQAPQSALVPALPDCGEREEGDAQLWPQGVHVSLEHSDMKPQSTEAEKPPACEAADARIACSSEENIPDIAQAFSDNTPCVIVPESDPAPCDVTLPDVIEQSAEGESRDEASLSSGDAEARALEHAPQIPTRSSKEIEQDDDCHPALESEPQIETLAVDDRAAQIWPQGADVSLEPSGVEPGATETDKPVVAEASDAPIACSSEENMPDVPDAVSDDTAAVIASEIEPAPCDMTLPEAVERSDQKDNIVFSSEENKPDVAEAVADNTAAASAREIEPTPCDTALPEAVELCNEIESIIFSSEENKPDVAEAVSDNTAAVRAREIEPAACDVTPPEVLERSVEGEIWEETPLSADDSEARAQQAEPQIETLEHVPQKWEPVLRKRTCSNKEVEQDDDSKKSHPALAVEHEPAVIATQAAPAVEEGVPILSEEIKLIDMPAAAPISPVESRIEGLPDDISAPNPTHPDEFPQPSPDACDQSPMLVSKVAPDSFEAAEIKHHLEKWEPVFGKGSCSNKELARDDDSKKNHTALASEAALDSFEAAELVAETSLLRNAQEVADGEKIQNEITDLVANAPTVSSAPNADTTNAEDTIPRSDEATSEAKNEAQHDAPDLSFTGSEQAFDAPAPTPAPSTSEDVERGDPEVVDLPAPPLVGPPDVRHDDALSVAWEDAVLLPEAQAAHAARLASTKSPELAATKDFSVTEATELSLAAPQLAGTVAVSADPSFDAIAEIEQELFAPLPTEPGEAKSAEVPASESAQARPIEELLPQSSFTDMSPAPLIAAAPLEAAPPPAIEPASQRPPVVPSRLIVRSMPRAAPSDPLAALRAMTDEERIALFS
jgi:hypothetical protein